MNSRIHALVSLAFAGGVAACGAAPDDSEPVSTETALLRHSCCEVATVFEGFEDDFVAGRDVPDTVDAALSSPFSDIDAKRPAASGFLTLRDRDVNTPGGEGGGFPPSGNVILDFTDGMGTFVTFAFEAEDRVAEGSFVGFDVAAYGGDGGSLFKSVSSDGVTFTPVGDAASDNGTYEFDLPAGGEKAYLRLQVGTAAGIWEGVHIDNISASVKSCEPRHPRHPRHHPHHAHRSR